MTRRSGFFFVRKLLDICMDTNLIENRQDLVNKYNASVGEPGPLVTELQCRFLTGDMDPSLVKQYVAQCEVMIESRDSLRRRASAR